MEGQAGRWRLRVGQYRGIFEVEGGTVRFVRFGHRSSIYR
ncbi:MAG TPA: type II toxin-antitoxin system RelE/ParE family toxin [Candidatus Thermoplasmatota archaeon]|nr:type II toxin-antitoxin system RelE/ParE family toxin [Candidatus Thermoplasmatota archaeon]